MVLGDAARGGHRGEIAGELAAVARSDVQRSGADGRSASPQGNSLLKRDYRAPYVIAEQVGPSAGADPTLKSHRKSLGRYTADVQIVACVSSIRDPPSYFFPQRTNLPSVEVK